VSPVHPDNTWNSGIGIYSPQDIIEQSKYKGFSAALYPFDIDVRRNSTVDVFYTYGTKSALELSDQEFE
jgi:hypothetical protein